MKIFFPQFFWKIYLTYTPHGYILIAMKDIQTRLKRIEGQVRGLQNLLETTNDCEKIIVQFQAVQGALDTCFSKLLHKNLQKCFISKDPAQLENILKTLVKKR